MRRLPPASLARHVKPCAIAPLAMKARVRIGWVTLDSLLFSEQFESAEAEVQLIGARQVEADTPEVLEGSPGLREHNYGRVLQTRGRPKWRKSYHV